MRPSYSLSNIFQDAARSKVTHKKNLLSLRKQTSQETFQIDFLQAVCRVLPVKKGNSDAENVLKFVKSYFELLESSESTQDSEASASLAEFLIMQLLPGLDAGNKMVRFRVSQIFLILLNHLNELPDNLFEILRVKILEKSKDKEAIVRMQACMALCRLQDEEDQEIVERLAEMMQFDPSADVRRNIVGNMTFSSSEIRILFVQRARDTDAHVRIAVYQRIIKDMEEITEFTLEQVVYLLKAGLSDRDFAVRQNCSNMFLSCWLKQRGDNILHFLNDLNVMANYETAELCVKAFFKGTPDFEFVYQEDFWANLAPAKAFLIQSFATHNLDNEKLDEYENALPELVTHVEFLKKYTAWMISVQSDDERLGLEFIVGELLKITLKRDFCDETGRREALNFLRMLLVKTDASEEHIQIAIQCIRKISNDEIDFLRIIAEMLYDIEEEADEPDATNEEVEITRGVRMLKCLDMIKSAFYSCRIGPHENEPMNGILERFVLPCLQSPQMALRCAGIESLGLVCLLDKNMAFDNYRLFEFGFNCNDKFLVELSLKILLDLALVHGLDVFDGEADENAIESFILKALNCPEPSIIKLAVEGTAKLMVLAGLKKAAVLKTLYLLYFCPATKSIPGVHQCLGYFFEAFSFSSPERQALVAEVFLDVVKGCIEMGETFTDMIPINHIVQQLIDWTDVRRLRGDNHPNKSIHFGMVRALTHYCFEELPVVKRRNLCQCLTKFHIKDFAQDDLDGLLDVTSAAENLLSNVSGDLISTNAVKRFIKLVSGLESPSPIATDEVIPAEETEKMAVMDSIPEAED